MPTTGGRSEIGPYPQWTSLYLCSMDYRLAEVTINYGDLSGSIPFHFRESDPARSFYCRPFKVDDRPTIWTTQIDVGYIQQYIAPADRFPAAIGDLTTPWTVETAHAPSLAYVPYLMTGDLYYLEEMHFWATYVLGGSNGSYRGGAQCWLIDQIRGNAWSLRSVVDAAAMTPDTMPEKAYLNEKIANNITRWNNMFIHSEGPSIRTYGAGSYTGDPAIDPANCSYASGIWQDDYFTWAFIHAYQMGYPTLDLVHWGSKGVIDRFTDWPGWNRFRGAPYAMPAMGKDAGGNADPVRHLGRCQQRLLRQGRPGQLRGCGGQPEQLRVRRTRRDRPGREPGQRTGRLELDQHAVCRPAPMPPTRAGPSCRRRSLWATSTTAAT